MSKNAVDSILDSATTLFAQRGVNGVSLAEIAKRAKVSSGLIIYHFKSKDNLLFIVSRELFLKLYRKSFEVMSVAKTPLDALNALVDAFFSFAAENTQGITFLARFDPFLNFDMTQFPEAELRILKERFIGLIKEYVVHGISREHFKSVSYDTFPAFIWSMLLGICHTYNDYPDHAELCNEMKRVVTLRLTGLSENHCQVCPA